MALYASAFFSLIYADVARIGRPPGSKTDLYSTTQGHVVINKKAGLIYFVTDAFVHSVSRSKEKKEE